VWDHGFKVEGTAVSVNTFLLSIRKGEGSDCLRGKKSIGKLIETKEGEPKFRQSSVKHENKSLYYVIFTYLNICVFNRINRIN
jgi:hypothetical protein